MVEVFVPFLLIIMNWSPADPQATMEVQQRLHIGIAECVAAGREIERLREGEPSNGRAFAWTCEPHLQYIEVPRPAPDSQ